MADGRVEQQPAITKSWAEQKNSWTPAAKTVDQQKEERGRGTGLATSSKRGHT